MQAHLIAAGMLLAATAPAAADPKIEITGKGGLDKATIERVVGEFSKVCTPLMSRYVADVSVVEVETMPEYASYRLADGWKTMIHLTIRVPDKPKAIPEFDDRTGVITGHVLHYSLGGGSKPGMYGSKRVSQMLCGMPITDIRSIKHR